MSSATPSGSGGGDGFMRLSGAERRFLVLLGAPALGMAFAVTVVSTYLPVLLQQISGPIAVGLLIGAEGFLGIFTPALVGSYSDRTASTVGDRMRLLLGCALVVVLAMTAVGGIAATGAGSVAPYAVALVVLYTGYYAFLAPYWTLYADLVPEAQSGRSRSAEATWRVTGVGLALVAGGLLLDLAESLPFLAATVAIGATIAALAVALRHRLGDPVETPDEGAGAGSSIRVVLRDRQIRRLCVANALWNFALATLRAFVVLFFVVGLGRSSTFVATVIFPLVAVGLAVAAPTAGWVADRFGHVRLLTAALVLYGAGMALPAFTQHAAVIAIIPVVAAGAATVMTLPLSVLMRLLPEQHHGSASGLFGLSRGVGATLGPVLTGFAIPLVAPVFDSTQGYGVMWLMCSAALLASIPLMWSLRGDQRL
jgi:Na+/melibiose symporter-like transporter